VGGVSLNDPLNAMLRAMADRRPSIDQLADHLVADLVERGRFDVVHVAFGYGVHGCPGQGPTRMQCHAVLSSLIKRVETLRLTSSSRTVNNITRSFSSVQVAVT
jgi:hypothetical protein